MSDTPPGKNIRACIHPECWKAGRATDCMRAVALTQADSYANWTTASGPTFAADPIKALEDFKAEFALGFDLARRIATSARVAAFRANHEQRSA